MSRWFRLYADAMRNPKVMRLSDFEFRLWVKLLAVASENDGHIPCAADLKLMVNVRLDNLLRGLNALVTGALLDADADVSGGYTPHNWNKFQYKSDTSNERVAKHRAKRNVTVTPPDTETDTEQKERDDDVSASVRASGNFDLLELTNECAKAGGVRHLEPAAIARHVDQVREWQSAGVLPAEMLAWIRDVTSRHTEPIRSLKFFDAHIRQAIARKDNPHGNQSTVVGFGAARIRAGQGNPRAVAARELVAEAVEREQREAALLGEGGGNNWGIGAALPAEWR